MQEDRQRRALLREHFPRPAAQPAVAEYCQLPVGVKAAIAARLTADMLEVRCISCSQGEYDIYWYTDVLLLCPSTVHSPRR